MLDLRLMCASCAVDLRFGFPGAAVGLYKPCLPRLEGLLWICAWWALPVHSASVPVALLVECLIWTVMAFVFIAHHNGL